MKTEKTLLPATRNKPPPMDRVMLSSESKGTRIRVNTEDMKPFFEPTLSCFCKKPVHHYHTLEYGPILECASYDESSPYFNTRFACGFHAHELSWLKVRQHVLEGYPLYTGYKELDTCPLYNFTFCGLFKVINDFKSFTTTMPDCFCNRPTTLAHQRERGQENKNEAPKTVNFISCSNRSVPGAPKCNYFNSSNVTVFPKQKRRLHTAVDEQVYKDALDAVKRKMNLSKHYKYLPQNNTEDDT